MRRRVGARSPHGSLPQLAAPGRGWRRPGAARRQAHRTGSGRSRVRRRPRRRDRRNGLRVANGTAWREMVFATLPETTVEADAASAALRSMGLTPKVLLGAAATPEALTGADAPAIVHVASHGFVLAPSPETDGQERWRVRVMMPGQLAGLALAANGRHGGVLMASDLESANLRDTRLLVLSACDTGNGQTDVHEGLASLRRAAEAAGVRATVTSLWPVPSQPTVELMKNFYSALAAGQAHSEALRTAKLELRRSGAPVRDWAGFVVAGADR
ncbi:MAG: CHAT domain-containing protein [Comamonadaceae bacterium]|nr:CHAT domain-containing protein [Comamonadaceae bacterium]